MSDPVIELVKLENGDIALRNSDVPDEPLVTIAFSEQINSFLQTDKLEVARAMVEAGMNCYQNIHAERTEQVKQASEAGMLH